MNTTDMIAKFNRECRPFYLVDLQDGRYSLRLLLDSLVNEFAPYCQEAFNAYAVANGGESLTNGLYTYGMATVRPGVMKKAAYSEEKANVLEVVKVNVELAESDIKTEVVEVVKAAKKLVDLVGAEYIVSVGRGIAKDVEGGIKLAEELAEVLGGVVGGSRVAIDSGWLTADHQVGQTGKTVHPKVYIALGISGAIQHKAGMSESGFIIAVNKNETAPIFEIADLGLCGDLFKITPMLTEAIRNAKADK